MARILRFPSRPATSLRRNFDRTTLYAAGTTFAVVFTALSFDPATLFTGQRSVTGKVSGPIGLCADGGSATCIVDGDTIRYAGVKIRLSDIDTPEVFSPRCSREAELGRRATERLRILVNDGPFDIVARGRDEDRYGRKLRELRRNGVSLGDTLVDEGLAHRWHGHKESWC